MTTKTRPVSKTQAEKVLAQVAAWMGRRGYGTASCRSRRALTAALYHVDDGTPCEQFVAGPAPTGPDAAYNGTGPDLVMDFDWFGTGPTPSVVLEGGPYGWPIEVAETINVPGVWVEPATGFALSIYRKEV